MTGKIVNAVLLVGTATAMPFWPPGKFSDEFKVTLDEGELPYNDGRSEGFWVAVSEPYPHKEWVPRTVESLDAKTARQWELRDAKNDSLLYRYDPTDTADDKARIIRKENAADSTKNAGEQQIIRANVASYDGKQSWPHVDNLVLPQMPESEPVVTKDGVWLPGRRPQTLEGTFNNNRENGYFMYSNDGPDNAAIEPDNVERIIRSNSNGPVSMSESLTPEMEARIINYLNAKEKEMRLGMSPYEQNYFMRMNSFNRRLEEEKSGRFNSVVRNSDDAKEQRIPDSVREALFQKIKEWKEEQARKKKEAEAAAQRQEQAYFMLQDMPIDALIDEIAPKLFEQQYFFSYDDSNARSVPNYRPAIARSVPNYRPAIARNSNGFALPPEWPNGMQRLRRVSAAEVPVAPPVVALPSEFAEWINGAKKGPAASLDSDKANRRLDSKEENAANSKNSIPTDPEEEGHWITVYEPFPHQEWSVRKPEAVAAIIPDAGVWKRVQASEDTKDEKKEHGWWFWTWPEGWGLAPNGNFIPYKK